MCVFELGESFNAIWTPSGNVPVYECIEVKKCHLISFGKIKCQEFH